MVILYLFTFWSLQQVGPIFTYHRKSDYSRLYVDHLTRQAFINGELLIPGIRLSTVVVPQTKTTCTNGMNIYCSYVHCRFLRYFYKISHKNCKRHVLDILRLYLLYLLWASAHWANIQLINFLGTSKYTQTIGKTCNAPQTTLIQKAHYQHKPQFPTR